jgi:class 3 adenylate cyclase
MTLVERFIDFHDWPTSRKSALAGVLVIPTLLFVLAFLMLAQPRAIDVPMLVKLFLGGVGIAGVIGAVSWGVYRRGREGRWTAYAFVFLYQVWVTVVAVALGGFASPFLAFPLFLPLFSMLWYGVRLGLVSVVSIFTVLVAGSVLALTGVLPFAPVMLIRDIDGLNTVDWLVASIATSFIVAVAIYLVLFVEIAAAELQHGRLKAAHRLIRRYVPEQVAETVLSTTPETLERHERRKLTIFFSDLVGFTDLSDEMEPEDLATVLHDYFTAMSAIARKHAGTVDDLVGDAVLVLFGAPDFTDDHDQALRAVRMAVEMQAAMGPLNQRWEAAGIPEALTVRMGINTGVATVGNFGSADRTKYTALGKQVNVAARIQSYCEPGKVLLGHTTWLLVRDEIACVPKGELELKGLRKPMPAYEVHA